MRPQPFVDLLKQWLTSHDHPGIGEVHTCADVGRWEHPVGVRVTLSDGWALLVGFVRSSPPGGDTDRPDLPQGSWGDDPGYRAARKQADAAAAAVKAAARGGRPQAKVNDVLAILLDVVKRADHAGVASAEVVSRGGRRPVLLVECADGSTLYGSAVGWLPPGGVDFAHPAYEIPDGWF